MSAILASPEDAPRIVESLRGARRIAIDTEFHAERRFVPELYLVQIHVDRGDPAGPTWIVDPLHGDLVARIAPALLEVPWVVHGGEQDMRVLSIALGGLPERIDDTQLAAGLLSDHWPAPYGGLVGEHLGTSIEKGETLSDWSRRPLTAAQLTYAALNVELLLQLWDRLAEGLERRGRTEIARRACDEARRVAVDPPDDADAFRTLPVVPTLPPARCWSSRSSPPGGWSGLAPPTSRCARSCPTGCWSTWLGASLRAPQPCWPIAGCRGTWRAMRRSWWSRIARARTRPDWAIPLVVRRRTEEWRAAQWLQLWAEEVGAERDFAANLALPRPVIERLVLESPTEHSEIARILGWRDGLLGDDLALVRQGGVALRLAARRVVREERAAGDSSAIPAPEKIS